MDIVLELADTFLFDRVYALVLPSPILNVGHNATTRDAGPPWTYRPASAFMSAKPTEAALMSAWPRDNIYRQAISLFLMTWIFGLIVYFVFAALSYAFVYDKALMKHPKFLKNQVAEEIRQSSASMPIISLLTTPIFVAEVRGHSKIYDTTAEGPGWWYNFLQFPFFLLFTDLCIYWIHRGLHHPLVYKYTHKPHHKWIIPTPFASLAFHPLDGFAQGLPYHIFPFLFPLQKLAYVFFFVFVTFWTILIHDGEYMANNSVINGAACHSVHHLAFNYNYGQYTTLWDRIGGSYRRPAPELFSRETRMARETWQTQVREMEAVVEEVEGEDEREYVQEGKKTR